MILTLKELLNSSVKGMCFLKYLHNFDSVRNKKKYEKAKNLADLNKGKQYN